MNVDTPIKTLLSVCSGTGMLDEGFQFALEQSGFGSRAVCYCERESSAAACIMARMEEQSLEPTPVWAGNMEDMPAKELRGMVDFVIGGIPCQPFSQAGKQEGLEDERWLWPAFWQIVRDSGAKGFGIENVGGFVRDGLQPILDEIAEAGWLAEWCHLRASEVGASHSRERIFLLAHSGRAEWGRREDSHDIAGQRTSSDVTGADAELADSGCSNDERRGEPGELCGTQGEDDRETHQRERDGDSACDGCEDMADTAGSIQGRRSGAIAGTSSGQHGEFGGEVHGVGLADSSGERLQRSEWSGAHGDQGQAARRSVSECGSPFLFAPGPSFDGWGDIIRDYPHLAPAVESGLCVLVDGVAYLLDASRADQLRSAGNGVVALQAAVAFSVLFERIKMNL